MEDRQGAVIDDGAPATRAAPYPSSQGEFLQGERASRRYVHEVEEG